MKIIDESELQKLRNKKKVDFKEYSKTVAPLHKTETYRPAIKEDPTLKAMESIMVSFKETISQLKENDKTSMVEALKILQENFNKSLETVLSKSKMETIREDKIIMPERTKKWSFSIKRNDRGYIEEIIAEAKE